MSHRKLVIPNDTPRRSLSRRKFLSIAVVTGIGAVVASCAPAAAPTPTPVPPKPVAPTPAPTPPPLVTPIAKPFAGVTINGAMFDHEYPRFLQEFMPDFEAKTGMKVNLEIQAFPVYNQRADLELSTKGSAYDFLNVTFIYSSRWIGAGWVTNLEEFLKDPNKTPPDWDPEDFLPGTMVSLKDAKGNRYGFPWEAGAMIACASRYDLIEKAGLKMPETFDEMEKVLAAVHDKDGVKAFVADNLHHWHWIPWLMGFGGGMFKDPPDNLTPTLDTPEAIHAAEWYAKVLMTYSPEGVLTYSHDMAMVAQLEGRANYRTQSIPWVAPVGDPKKSKVAKTARYGMMPAGPKGAFPGTALHGLGIPVGSKKKDAAWEFIKWAVSKEIVKRTVVEKGYGAPCRRSAIDSPEYKKRLTINDQDVAALYVKVLDIVGKTGYMKYRTVHVFPQVGDKINKAIEIIATKQLPPAEAMKRAQAEAIADLKKAGVKVD